MTRRRRDDWHDGPPAPKRAELSKIAKRAYGGCQVELERAFGSRVMEFLTPWERQPVEVRDRWRSDVLNVYLGGKCLHPLPWCRIIIIHSVRIEE